jgi:hypothetical protein
LQLGPNATEILVLDQTREHARQVGATLRLERKWQIRFCFPNRRFRGR